MLYVLFLLLAFLIFIVYFAQEKFTKKRCVHPAGEHSAINDYSN